MSMTESTAVAVHPGAPVPAGARPEHLDFGEMLKRAQVLARTKLVTKDLQGQPEAMVLVGALGAELGVPFVTALSEIHVIDGKPSPSAQLRLALITRAGHEAMFLETTPTRAVIRGRRRENRHDPEAWTKVSWTIEQARHAGLLDQWVERWQKTESGKSYKERFVLGRDDVDVPDWVAKEIRAGNLCRKDNWAKYPAEMLRARAASALCRMVFADVLAGMGVVDHTAEELGLDVDQDLDEVLDSTLVGTVIQETVEDEDIIDGEVVEPTAAEPDDVGGENGEASPVVEVSTAPCPVDGDAWRALCREHGVSQAAILRRAREAATAIGQQAPSSLDELADCDDITQELAAWVAAGGVA